MKFMRNSLTLLVDLARAWKTIETEHARVHAQLAFEGFIDQL